MGNNKSWATRVFYGMKLVVIWTSSRWHNRSTIQRIHIERQHRMSIFFLQLKTPHYYGYQTDAIKWIKSNWFVAACASTCSIVQLLCKFLPLSIKFFAFQKKHTFKSKIIQMFHEKKKESQMDPLVDGLH